MADSLLRASQEGACVNYYQHHIGDFRAGTFTMGRLERWLYRDMMDMYYDGEKPLPLDHEELFYTLGTTDEQERTAVERLLKFKFEKTPDGYRHQRCDAEIRAFHEKGEKASAAGKASAAMRAIKKATDVEPDSNGRSTAVQRPSTNHKPLTNNQSKTSSSAPGPAASATGTSDAADAAERRGKRRGTSDDEKCARWLFGRVLANNSAARPPNFDTWADEVRLMRERDGREHAEICELFQWAQADSFWQSNILSPSKLREKWDQLTMRRGAPAGKAARHADFGKQDYSKGVGPNGEF